MIPSRSCRVTVRTVAPLLTDVACVPLLVVQDVVHLGPIGVLRIGGQGGIVGGVEPNGPAARAGPLRIAAPTGVGTVGDEGTISKQQRQLLPANRVALRLAAAGTLLS